MNTTTLRRALLATATVLAGFDASAADPAPANEQVVIPQVDRRDINSWRLRMHEVQTAELLEVHLVNAIAPYILNARLKALMVATPGASAVAKPVADTLTIAGASLVQVAGRVPRSAP